MENELNFRHLPTKVIQSKLMYTNDECVQQEKYDPLNESFISQRKMLNGCRCNLEIVTE